MYYEKLGLKEAQGAYRRLIDTYPEQADQVKAARSRLVGLEKTLKRPDRGPVFRKIEIASQPQNGVLSPEGDKLAFMSDGAVWFVPLHGKVDSDIAGEPVRLAEVQGLWEDGKMLSWSADGQWIAVYSDIPDFAEGSKVTVIPVKGGAPKVIHLPAQGGHLWGFRLSLSPDGRMLAFQQSNRENPEMKYPGATHAIFITSL